MGSTPPCLAPLPGPEATPCLRRALCKDCRKGFRKDCREDCREDFRTGPRKAMSVASIISCLSIFCLSVLAAKPGVTHELWLSPETYSYAPPQDALIDLRNGQYFNGITLPYFPQSVDLFLYANGPHWADYQGRIGDYPAMQLPALPEGLWTIAYQTTPEVTTYSDLSELAAFAQEKGAPWLPAAHRASGLPEHEIRESYTRHAKAVVRVGHGKGADQEMGLAVEFIMDPLTQSDLSQGPPQAAFTLLRRGLPWANAPIQLYTKPAGQRRTRANAPRHLRSDAEGRLVFDVLAGQEYLLNAVHLEPAPETGNRANADPVAPAPAHWRSLWASFTFALPKSAPAAK